MTGFWARLRGRAHAAPPAAPAPGRREPRLADPRRRPGAALQARAYAGALRDRLVAGLTVSGASANHEVQAGLWNLRAAARDFERNSNWGRRFYNLLERNVVGPAGIRLQPVAQQVPGGDLDEIDNARVAEAWADWGEAGTCTVDGRLSWPEVQALALRSWKRDGEVLVRLVKGREAGNRYNLALQVLEADLLDPWLFRTERNGNRIVMGVELNRWWRPVAYWLVRRPAHLSPWSEGPVQTVGRRDYDYERVPAEEMIHLYRAERPDQVRGVPATASVTRNLHMLDGLQEAELVASRMAANKVFVAHAPDGDGSPLADGESAAGALHEISEPGETAVAPPGYRYDVLDPQHPNAAFGDFVKAMLRSIASGLDVSYTALANDLEGVNYSSIRQGELDQRDAWRQLQGWLVAHLCTPVYRSWLDMAILSGALPFPQDRVQKWQRVRWIARGWSWVDPLKEINATAKAIDYRLTSRSRVAAQSGEDWDQTAEEIGREQDVAAGHGLALPEDETQGPADGADTMTATLLAAE